MCFNKLSVFPDDLWLKVQMGGLVQQVSVEIQSLSHPESPFILDLSAQVQVHFCDQQTIGISR